MRLNSPLIGVFAAIAVGGSGCAGQSVSGTDAFLAELVGAWSLTATMGTTEQRQEVEAAWVLQGHFLEMRITEIGRASERDPPYEAIYLIGYDESSGEYVMHLFDTFGVGYSRTIGVGTRRENSVEFLFRYPGGPFSNTFTWYRATRQWEMVLRQQDETGAWNVFALKTLSRD